MRSSLHIALVVLLGGASTILAQDPIPLQTKQPAVPAPAPTVLAATVNGQNIQELAVFRALQRVPQSKQAEALASTHAKKVVNLLEVPPEPELRQILLQVKFATIDRTASRD